MIDLTPVVNALIEEGNYGMSGFCHDSGAGDTGICGGSHKE